MCPPFDRYAHPPHYPHADRPWRLLPFALLCLIGLYSLFCPPSPSGLPGNIASAPIAHAAQSAPTTPPTVPREIAVYVYHRPPFFTATAEGQGGPLVEMTLAALDRKSVV